jgi:demethylsterigmatocystin 6-O-methyltransferase
MRNILHDWPDEKCKEILQNLMPAMGNESVILIDEMVMPEAGASARATQLDLAMLTMVAAKERTLKEWQALLQSVGLEIVKLVKYTEECDDFVIVAKPKSGA